MKYRKSDDAYVLSYDEMTISACKDFLERRSSNKSSGDDSEELIVEKMMRDLVANVSVEFVKVDHFSKKKRTIEEWKRDDERRDEIVEKTEWKYGEIKCLLCGHHMTFDNKTLEERGELDKARVLFMFSCEGSQHKKRAFYDNGEEYKIKGCKCIKCGYAVVPFYERQGDVITTIFNCESCGNKELDVLELNTKKLDPDFEEDRKKYCLSEEVGNASVIGMANLQQFSVREKEREENKDAYEKIAKVERLTIIELEKRLAEALEKKAFVRFHLKDPERGHTVEMFVPFVVYDEKKDRNDVVSAYDLNKQLRLLLKDTNWRLMSDGVSYKVGMLEGRLRVYDT